MKIFLFYSTAGEGHKKIAQSIEQELKTRREFSDVRSFDALETAGKWFRSNYEKIYFNSVKYCPKMWGLMYELTDQAWFHFLIKAFRAWWNRKQSKQLRAFLQNEKPDVIITTHFYSAEVIATAKHKGEIQSRLITVITDVMPHAFWVNEGTDLYWVMAEESKQELVRRKVPIEQVVAGGIPIKMIFSRTEDRNRIQQDLHLYPDRFTILFSSGSFGIGPTRHWLNELEQFFDRVQVVVVCGKNEELKSGLADLTFKFPIKILGFVDNMHELMSVADLLIAKSGGSTTCESLAKGLPMLISAPIPGQETRNATWLVRNRASLQIKGRTDLANVLKSFLETHVPYDVLKSNIARIAKPRAAADLADFLLKDICGQKTS